MNKVLKIFLLFFFLINYNRLVSQPSITWEKIYNNVGTRWDGFLDICQADSGNYFLAGYTLIPTGYNKIWVIKINSYGDTIWTRAIGINGGVAYSIVSSGDGGCVLTGSANQAFTIKLEANGNTVWEKYYGGSYVECRKIIKTSNDGYIACGRINFFQDGYILKIDAQGILEWQKTYTATDEIDLYDIIQDKESYYYTGLTSEYPGDTTKTLFTKIDNQGKVVSEKKIKVQNRPTRGYKILKHNNNFILSGSIPDEAATNTFTFFVKVDTTGNILYEKIFNSVNHNSFADIKILKENRFIIATSIRINNALNGRAFITDSLGNIIYERLFTTSDYMDWSAILPLDNGDLIITGLADLGLLFEEELGYAVRTDSTLFYKPVSVKNNSGKILNQFELYQNYPNPFNPNTKIKFDIKKSGLVEINIYNINGRLIETLIDERLTAGAYEVLFISTNVNPGLSSGIYFYELVFEKEILDTKKMILIK